MRLAVYCDYPYRIQDGGLYADQPVALFLGQLSDHVDRLTMVGRLDSTPGAFPYRIENADFAGLPHYSSGAAARSLLRSIPISLARFWRTLDRVDAAWVFGPTPISLLFAGLTLARRRRLVLGVRQDLPELFDHRYPDRALLRLGARSLERAFRLLSRRVPVVVVGPELARHYRHARQLHTTYVSLLRERDIAAAEPQRRRYDGPELSMLSVGRIDPEKNPLLLADILAGALGADRRWRLDVCGAGPLTGALQDRLRALGVADRATLHGHVPIDRGLLALYDSSHAFVHVSHTEGVPQVLIEAFARRLPVVATAVGGVPELVTDCGLLIPPRRADAAVQALHRLSADPELREQLVQRAVTRAHEHTREAESARLAAFLRQVADPGSSATPEAT